MRTQRAVPECIAAFDKAIAPRTTPTFDQHALCKTAAKDKAGALADLKAAVSGRGFAPAWLGLSLHEEAVRRAAAEWL
jgi:hypothetical protein